MTANDKSPSRAAGALLGATPLLLWAVGVFQKPEHAAALLALSILLAVFWFTLDRTRLESLFNTTLLVSSLSISASACDLVARPILRDFMYYRPDELYIRHMPELPLLTRYVPLVTDHWRISGDLAAMTGDAALREYREATFESDALGFRNGAAASGPYDVIVVGDSFGMGLGTDQAHAWVDLLRKRTGLKVYNLSLPGIGPVQESLHLEMTLPALDVRPGAEVLLLLYTGNDLPDSERSIAAMQESRARHFWERGYTVLRDFQSRSALSNLGKRLVNAWQVQERNVLIADLPGDDRRMLFYAPAKYYAELTGEQVRAHRGFPNLREGILRIETLCRERSLRLKIIVLPAKEEIYGWLLDGSAPFGRPPAPSGFASEILAICRESGLDCMDSKNFLHQKAAEAWNAGQDLIWWLDDTHWDEDGHSAFADYAASTLLPHHAGASNP